MGQGRRVGKICLVGLLIVAESVAAPLGSAADDPTPAGTSSDLRLLTRTVVDHPSAEILVANFDEAPNQDGVLIGDGKATLVTGVGTTDISFERSFSARAAAAADIDADDSDELIGATTSALFQVTPSGSLLSLLEVGDGIVEISPLRLDGDGAEELAVLYEDGARVDIVDLGTRSSVRSVTLPTTARTLVTGDFDGDGSDEAIALGTGGSTLVGSTPARDESYPGIPGLVDGVAARNHGDAASVIAVATTAGVELLVPQDGDLLSLASLTTPEEPRDIDVVPDGSADLELVVTTQHEVLPYTYVGGDTFSTAAPLSLTAGNVAAAIDDLNGDGVYDIAVVEEEGASLAVLRSNRAPAMDAVDSLKVVEDEHLSFELSAIDADSDALTYGIVDPPTAATIDSSTGVFSWVPPEPGTYTLRFTVADWVDETVHPMVVEVLAHSNLEEISLRAGDGGAVTGTVPLSARVTGAAERVTFQWGATGDPQWHHIAEDADGSDGWRAEWDSGNKNGSYRIRATASLGTDQVVDVATITVDNQAPTVKLTARRAFSPNGDGAQDVLRIRGRVDERSKLRLVLSRSGVRLRTWNWKGPRRRVDLRWSGRVAGRKMRDGRYRLQIRAIDRVAKRGTSARVARIDTKAPKFRWDRVPPRLVTDDGRLRFAYRAGDAAGPVQVQLRVSQGGRSVALHKKKLHRRRSRWTPAPRYPDGSAFVPGSYVIRARVRDRVGNAKWSAPKRWEYAPPTRARSYLRLENTGRRVALTFDDCNYGPTWESILRTLRAHGAKATFFCGGSLVRRYPTLARRTVREGHDPAAHGYNHLMMTTLSSTAARGQIAADRKAWLDVTGRAGVPFFRPPYGAYDGSTLSIAGSLGYSRVMLWDVDTMDWSTQSAISTSSHVLSNARPGSVVLMHVLPSTAAALPAILKGLKTRRLEPVTLTRLFRAGGHH